MEDEIAEMVVMKENFVVSHTLLYFNIKTLIRTCVFFTSHIIMLCVTLLTRHIAYKYIATFVTKSTCNDGETFLFF